MKRVIIIQARMTSTRLPGKVLMDVAGKPMLAQQITRLRGCSSVDEIVIATTTNKTDDPVVELAREERLPWYRGSEDDVLSRFVGAAQESHADVIVRITADCPLIDAGVVDRVITELIDHSDNCDYASNVIKRTYPRGLDVEAFFADTLERFDRLANTSGSREHVTTVLREMHPELFLTRAVTDKEDNSDLRWTVDTAADLELIRIIYEKLELGKKTLPYSDILSFVRSQPELSQINMGIETWDPAHKS